LGDYVGVGPGAHGRLTRDGKRLATETRTSPKGWLKAVQAAGHGIDQQTEVPPDACGEEYLMMALRLSEGMSLARFYNLAGVPFEISRAAPLIDEGLLAHEGDRLRATAKGRPLLNALIMDLLA
jgi:oxygen-independent coproporphyrinogen-3 oxidase